MFAENSQPARIDSQPSSQQREARPSSLSPRRHTSSRHYAAAECDSGEERGGQNAPRSAGKTYAVKSFDSHSPSPAPNRDRYGLLDCRSDRKRITPLLNVKLGWFDLESALRCAQRAQLQRCSTCDYSARCPIAQASPAERQLHARLSSSCSTRRTVPSASSMLLT